MRHRFNDLLEQGKITEPGATATKILVATAGSLIAYGTVKPSDGAVGYAPGCIFIHTDGGDNTALYVNEGTRASADFNLISVDSPIDLSGLTSSVAELNIMDGVTATAAEINQACDESANTEIVITTNVITAAESGKTFYLDLAAGFTSTLPAPAAGLRFRFIVKTAPTGAPYVITTNAGANLLYGHMLERAGGAGVAGAARDTFNFIHNQSIIGDWVEIYSDGTNWYYHGIVDVAAGNTVAAT